MQAALSPSHILTVLTPDRRGIIAALSGAVEQSGGRLLELSQTVVREYFTVTLVLHLPAQVDLDELSGRLRRSLASGAAVELLPYSDAAVAAAPARRYILTASGPDGSGKVPLLAGLIAERGGNFTDFSSRVVAGEVALIAEVELPPELALDQLQIDLQHAAAEVGLQARLQRQRLFAATNEIAFRRHDTH